MLIILKMGQASPAISLTAVGMLTLLANLHSTLLELLDHELIMRTKFRVQLEPAIN